MKATCFFLLLLAARVAAGSTFYVSTNGTNSASGSETEPWAEIQYALNHAASGDTVVVRGGMYPERVAFPMSGISLAAAEGEFAVLDGSAFTVGDGWDALITIEGQDDILVDGFTLRNLRTSVRNCVPIGLLVHDACRNITLKNLTIHDIETTYDGSRGGDAHGLAVYGTSAAGSVSNLLIENVEIYDCLLGSSESLVINGNVEFFTVQNCSVHDNNNIGIDFIGHEGTCPDPALDQARDGLCRSNLIENITTIGNPAYGNDRSSDGIYVDGGTRIVIEANRVLNGDIGIEVASEHQNKSTSYITVRNNIVAGNHTGGIFAGGYDARRGKTEYCTFTGNTLYQNDAGRNYNGEIYLQMYVENCSFRNNLLVARINDGNDAVFIGGIGGSGSNPVNTTFNQNLYFSPVSDPDHHLWTWGGQERYGFSNWRGLGQDSESLSGMDPLLRNPGTGNFHLQATSPAIGAGTNLTVVGDSDCDGQPRIAGGRIDIGADEYAERTLRGTPIDWLDAHGGVAGSYESADADDADGDGFAAWQEYCAGTDPNSAASRFEIIRFSPDAGLVWIGGTNADNTPFVIWQRSSLTTGVWSLVTNMDRLAGQDGTNVWTRPVFGASSIFYRVTASEE